MDGPTDAEEYFAALDDQDAASDQRIREAERAVCDTSLERYEAEEAERMLAPANYEVRMRVIDAKFKHNQAVRALRDARAK